MSISLAQIILIALIVAVIFYVFTVRSVSRDRAAMLVLAAAGCVLVIWPSLSTDVARSIGIGRGTDLVFYLFVVFCLFRFVSTAAEMRRLNDRLTRVVRDSALRTARPAPASVPTAVPPHGEGSLRLDGGASEGTAAQAE